MRFKEVKSRYYRKFFLSNNGEYSIGIESMLFKRMRVQVMYREKKSKDPDVGNWWVIREYVTYNIPILIQFIAEVLESLNQISDFTKGNDWKIVEGCLPVRNVKYLEDDSRYK